MTLISQTALANVGLDYGFGARTAGLAGAGAAWGFGAFAAYHNPAGLSFQGERRLKLEVGTIWMTPSFTPIEHVTTANTFTSDQVTTDQSVDTSYRSTLGTELGLVYRVAPSWANLSLGLTAFLPLEQVQYLDSGETFIPEYILYRARTQRPQVEIGLGADLGPYFHVGLGLHVAYTLTSNATVFLQTDPAKSSSMRFSASLKPKVAPVFGLLYTAPVETPEQQPWLTAGLVIRAPVASDSILKLNSGARALGGSIAAIDFNFGAAASLWYDPLTIELGTSIAETPNTRTYVQVDFQRWSKFEAPALLIQTPETTNCAGCGVKFSPSIAPTFEYRDIWVPRLAQDLVINRVTLRAGYSYRMSMLAGLPTGQGNYLDPPKHVITLGGGYHFDHFLSFDVPCDIDLNLAYHHLVTQHVSKSGTEIGAPGYDAGGKIYGAGLSLSLAF